MSSSTTQNTSSSGGGDNNSSSSSSTTTGKSNNASNKNGCSNKSTATANSDFEFDDNLEYWPPQTTTTTIKFVKIAAMHSELVALGKDGALYQWKWKSKLPYVADNSNKPNEPNRKPVFHPKTLELDLLNEKVVGLSTSRMRAAVWTESGKAYKLSIIYRL